MSCLNLNYLVYAYQLPQSLKESSFVTFEINFKRDHELARTVVSDTQGRIGDWEIIWADAEFLRFEVRIVSIFGAFSYILIFLKFTSVRGNFVNRKLLFNKYTFFGFQKWELRFSVPYYIIVRKANVKRHHGMVDNIIYFPWVAFFFFLCICIMQKFCLNLVCFDIFSYGGYCLHFSVRVLKKYLWAFINRHINYCYRQQSLENVHA